MTITRALPPGYPSSWVGVRCRGGIPVNKNSTSFNGLRSSFLGHVAKDEVWRREIALAA